MVSPAVPKRAMLAARLVESGPMLREIVQ